MCVCMYVCILPPNHTTSEKGGFSRALKPSLGNAQIAVEASVASWRHHTNTANADLNLHPQSCF